MNEFSNKTITKLAMEIDVLSKDNKDIIQLCETIIHKILENMATLKKFVLQNGFQSENEEIHFFKHLKPLILSKLIYYNSIYKIETKMPFGGMEVIKTYLNNEILKLKIFSDNNLDFCKYYRTNSTYLDHKYFVRGRYDIKLTLDTFFFEVDHSFSTSYDYKVAKIISNDLIKVYLENKLSNISSNSIMNIPNTLGWTASKAGLIELIYALHAQGTFDNGNADIKKIAILFENVFNIDLGNFYHTFLELKSGKINRTKFLDSLRDALIRKMDEEDEVQ